MEKFKGGVGISFVLFGVLVLFFRFVVDFVYFRIVFFGWWLMDGDFRFYLWVYLIMF